MRFLLPLIIILGLALPARADETADMGRALMTRYAGALVTLRMTVQESYSEPGMATEQEESEVEAPGTVVDPSGLTVTSLSLVDPSYLSEGAEKDEDFQYDIKITDAKMVLADGKELAVSLALRDKDLDLAVFKPEQVPAEPMPSVDLSTSATVDALDPVILLSRLGRIANRAVGGVAARINAVVRKPRQFYVLAQGERFTGAPAFTVTGQPIGIVTLRWIDMPEGEGMGMSGLAMGSDLTIILPASDVVDVLKQAHEEKTAEPAAP